MRIGIGNAEKVLFGDQGAWRHMPDLSHHRAQWAFSKTSPHLRPTGVRAMMDFLAEVEDRHAAALSDYFGEEVTIDKFDPSPIRNVEFDLGDPPDLDFASNYTAFSSHREGDIIKITFWR
jgi:hypothetical protein